ncbi:MAG: acetyl-CoA C-acyltransferase [Kofleriaceae bacterium]
MTRAAFLVDGLRSPFGRFGGSLAGVRPDDLAAQVIAALVAKTKIPADRIDDVILGCANQAGEDNRNVARMASLLAKLPIGVPGVTVNRLCGSGMQAVADAARLVATGEADLVIAGGVESMTRAPLVMSKAGEAWARNQQIYDTTLGWRFVNPKMEAMHGTLAMGETAEKVAERCNVSREAQDRFALTSQQRAAKAIASGRIAKELTPIVTGVDKKSGAELRFTADEHPRATSIEALAKLKPAFVKGSTTGTVTAGNAAGLNDGAAMILVASEQAIRELGLTPKARYVTGAAAGVEPSYMGLGPVPASKKALARAGLQPQQVDLAELNEAFAAQAIPCAEQLGLDPERVNVHGGAIAYGHPLGASGARLLLSLMLELEQVNAKVGLASMCIGVGQGIAVILERA